MAKLRWQGDFQYVSSACNLSDPISRGDLDTAAARMECPLERPRGLVAFDDPRGHMVFASGEAVFGALEMR